MATPAHDKYYLRSLHEEIALFDRKLAHLQRFETFASEKEKNAAAAKMSVKRGQLVRTAKELASAGIEFRPTDLPSSMRDVEMDQIIPVEQTAAPAETVESAPAIATLATKQKRTSPQLADSIREYLAQRKKPRQDASAA